MHVQCYKLYALLLLVFAVLKAGLWENKRTMSEGMDQIKGYVFLKLRGPYLFFRCQYFLIRYKESSFLFFLLFLFNYLLILFYVALSDVIFHSLFSLGKGLLH